MRAACERLRVLGDDGVTNGKGAAGGASRLFKQSIEKTGIWQGVPIESARIMKDYPSKEGWNHEWKAR
jgi:large subunit ribosomal protein L40